MKQLELISRKYTTANSRKQVIEFIESFDFDGYGDIGYIESKKFYLLFDATGNGCYHDVAYFALSDGRFRMRTYSSDLEVDEKSWSKIEEIFDGTCKFINFEQLIASIEDFVAKINKQTAEKETEISNFVEYAEGWKSYQDTLKNAAEIDEVTEEI